MISNLPEKAQRSDLNIDWTIQTKTVRGYQNTQHEAELVIQQDNKHDIGFKWNGTEYELMELGEYCDDNLTSIEASGYDVTDTLYVTADGDSLPSPVYPGNVEVHCGEDH